MFQPKHLFQSQLTLATQDHHLKVRGSLPHESAQQCAHNLLGGQRINRTVDFSIFAANSCTSNSSLYEPPGWTAESPLKKAKKRIMNAGDASRCPQFLSRVGSCIYLRQCNLICAKENPATYDQALDQFCWSLRFGYRIYGNRTCFYLRTLPSYSMVPQLYIVAVILSSLW